MGRQKMTKKHVLMIHHLFTNQGWNHKSISELVGMSREGVRNIVNHDTWKEFSAPEFTLGEELYYHFINKGDFE